MTTVLSWICLLVGVVAYGVGGANLATGSEGGLREALRSKHWWLGTGCQAVGFLFTLVARRALPLLLVQACVVGALAITAVIQDRTGVKRLTRFDSAAILAVIAGIAVVGTSSVAGPVSGATWDEAGVLAMSTALVILSLVPSFSSTAISVLYGCAAGVGFGVMAVAARLLVADTAHPLWLFWRLPAASWATGILGVVGLGLAQIHLTRGLARGSSVGVLSCMYALSTAYASGVGWLLLNEAPKPGSTPFLITGLVLGTLGAARLVRHVEEPPISPSNDALRT